MGHELAEAVLQAPPRGTQCSSLRFVAGHPRRRSSSSLSFPSWSPLISRNAFATLRGCHPVATLHSRRREDRNPTSLESNLPLDNLPSAPGPHHVPPRRGLEARRRHPVDAEL